MSAATMTPTTRDPENWGADPFRKPALLPDDVELASEHGRVIGPEGHRIDFRSHWLVLVKNGDAYALLVKHGGGEERLSLGYALRMAWLPALDTMTSDQRYLLLYTIHDTNRETRSTTATATATKYANAFVEGRLKKRRKDGRHWVEIAPE